MKAQYISLAWVVAFPTPIIFFLFFFLSFFAKKILLTNWHILGYLWMLLAPLCNYEVVEIIEFMEKKVCNKNKLVRRTRTNPRDHCTIGKPYLDLVSNAFWSKILVGWHSDAPPSRQYVIPYTQLQKKYQKFAKQCIFLDNSTFFVQWAGQYFSPK